VLLQRRGHGYVTSKRIRAIAADTKKISIPLNPRHKHKPMEGATDSFIEKYVTLASFALSFIIPRADGAGGKIQE